MDALDENFKYAKKIFQSWTVPFKGFIGHLSYNRTYIRKVSMIRQKTVP
jgi:hypothetical protein